MDWLRGLAVILMVVDHAAALLMPYLGQQSAGWATLWLVRHTLTRAALPLFLGVAGYLWASRLPRPGRLAAVLAAAVVCDGLGTILGFPWPDVLWLYCLGAAGASVVVRWPVQIAAAALVAWATFPLPGLNYHPGQVVGLLALGVLAARVYPEPLTADRSSWLCVVGRRPLTWYVVHLAVLALCHVAQSL